MAKKEHKLHIVEHLQIIKKYGVKRIDTMTCKIIQLLGIEKEDAEELGFECCYQWEKAAKQLKAQQNKRS